VKTRILSFSDSNMARSSWRWNFYLDDEDCGAYRLSCQQVITDDEALVIEPVLRLRRGADVYSALEAMLSEAGNSLEENELASIAVKIAKLDKRLADQFERGPKLLERRDAAAAKRAAAHSHAKLAQFRSIIDEYVLKFSDAPMRFAGGSSYGTQRKWAKSFIEQYVIENGQLPNGSHQIKVTVGGAGYSGATHDFSELKLTEKIIIN
jgi:hypothetical protein